MSLLPLSVQGPAGKRPASSHRMDADVDDAVPKTKKFRVPIKPPSASNPAPTSTTQVRGLAL